MGISVQDYSFSVNKYPIFYVSSGAGFNLTE
jgi:hypothetical protein